MIGPAMYRVLPLLVVMFTALLHPGPAEAQEAEPLQKSDLIRLLTGTTYSRDEVAGIIRQSCLSFTPTPRDRADFQALGADQGVLAAIDECGRRPAGPVLTASLERAIFDATAGDTVRVGVRITGAGGAEGGLRVRLVGSGRIRGGAGSDVVTVTDGTGRAVLVVPAGSAVGTYNMTVDTDVELGGSRAVTLRVSAGAAARAVGVPDPVQLASEDASAAVRIEVVDRFGNPVSGVEVSVRSGSATGTLLFAGRTSSSGQVEGTVTTTALGGANRLVIVSGSSVLGEAGVARPAARVASIVAVSGTSQGADFGRPLPEPFVVSVLDAGGAPAADVEVRFGAVNGRVEPSTSRTDAQGRVSASVTMGTTGTETTVTVTAGEVSRGYVFPITRGGMTVSAMEAALAQGASLLAAGDYQGAREVFGGVAAADPANLEAAVGLAESYAVEGRYGEAVERYRAVLRRSPGLREAQVGMARASLNAGDRAEAARWYELALSQDRADADSWAGLGDARAGSGDRDGARDAYQQALALEPTNAAAARGLARLRENPAFLEGDVWGGYTDDNGRDPSFRWAELRLYPGAGLELWGAFDNALNFRHPYLVRGQDDIEAKYGGLGFSYGPDRAYRTSFELGRREEPAGTIQTTWTLDQTIGFGSGSWFRVGGWLGHWYDQDDWVVFAESGLPVGPVVVKPTASYGNYFGSGFTGAPPNVLSRAPAKDLRVGLHVRYDRETGFGAEPAVAWGNVESDASEELSGALWDATLRMWYGFSRNLAVDSFFQYQTPPGLPSFWRVGLGLRFGIDRPGG